jgi:hypothetical protein
MPAILILHLDDDAERLPDKVYSHCGWCKLLGIAEDHMPAMLILNVDDDAEPIHMTDHVPAKQSTCRK